MEEEQFSERNHTRCCLFGRANTKVFER